MVLGCRKPLAVLALTAASTIVLNLLAAPASFGEITRQLISGGFSSPVHVAAPPGDTNRLFVVERGGLIRIINLSNQTVNGTPFIDVNDSPNSDVDTAGEGGLLSIAFHPNYSSNGFFFVYYTCDIDPGAPDIFGTRISRFTVTGNPDIADPNSETRFLELNSEPNTNHNGGMVAFKPNDTGNFLYVSLGDGGSGCDPNEQAQDINNKWGKILRIDIDQAPGGDLENPPAPADNPFVGQAGDDLVWVLGLRNPFRFSFDRANGDMYIGDVGQITREEISFQSGSSSGGENYGWDHFEGFLENPPSCGTDISPALPEMLDPIHDYPRSDGATVTGGNVYRGPSFSTMSGRYFFADFGNGRVWSFVRNGNGITDLQEHSSDVNPSADNISSFGEDGNGELYFTDFNGQVVQIVDPDSPPLFVDSDEDLLSDDDEITLGTDPNDPDTDGDGVIDGIEVELGTDPLDENDFPLLPVLRGWMLTGTLALALFGTALWFWRRRRSHN
jgi:glucose/arabinose dehydrogenase